MHASKHHITICMPYYPDCEERAANLLAQKEWLHRLGWHFDVEVIRDFQGSLIHRTKTLNNLASRARTQFISIHDVDVIFEPEQMEKALELLASGEYDFVWPYDGRFIRVNAEASNNFRKTFDMEYLRNDPQHNRHRDLFFSGEGGAIFVNREKYLAIGGENEKFIGYAPEDVERSHRMHRLGRWARVEGPLYHMYHPMGKQSSPGHQFAVQNAAELSYVKSLTDEQLKEYIATWK